MNRTPYTFANHDLAALSIGCMRFPSREAAADVIRTCVARGARYLDTSPMYCYRSEEENTETWTGAAIEGLRDQVILSAKCATGNGGDRVGEYDPAHGFSITTADQVRRQIDQSLRRLNVDRFDCYQLWAVHNPELFDVALRPGGWLEGVQRAREEGLFTHLGITGHADSAEIKRWVDSGLFELITVPFHLLGAHRLEGIQYALDHGIAVIAMNPLAGGMLGGESNSLAREFAQFEVISAADLALRYVASMGCSALSGMTSGDEARENATILGRALWTPDLAERIRARFETMISNAEYVCSGCGYCLPCAEELDIPGVLRLRNYHVVLHLEAAKREFQQRVARDHRFKVENCQECGLCESRCPNQLPVINLLKEARESLLSVG